MVLFLFSELATAGRRKWIRKMVLSCAEYRRSMTPRKNLANFVGDVANFVVNFDLVVKKSMVVLDEK